jgi:hypothetical protein
VALLVDQPPDPEPPPASPHDVTPPPGPSVKTAPPQIAKAKPTRITIPDEVAAPREPLHLTLGVTGEAAAGVLPGIQPALSAYLKFLPPQFYPITLQGEAFRAARAERNAESGARFRLFRVGLSVCPPVSRGRAHAIQVCVGQRLGWLQVVGYGFDHDRTERRLTYALNLGADAQIKVAGPVSIRGYLGGEVPVVRDRFASSGRQASDLFRPSPIAALAEIGLEAALW